MTNKTSRVRGTSTPIEEAAKQLRKTLTPTEQKLWQELRGGKLAGLKFRRQHPVGNFILDFYCPAYKLVIEVDGEVHQNQTDYDSARTAQLENHGYKVLRFPDEAVIHHLETVLSKILQATSDIDTITSANTQQDKYDSDPPSPKFGRRG
jgi:very-short-patch-repair endonuclease